MSAEDQRGKGKARGGRSSSRLGLIILTALVVWGASVLWQGRLLPEGTLAPEWSLTVAEGSGKKLSLEELRGKVVVLDFWSTGCPPCIREMAELEALSLDMSGRGVVVVGIAAWDESVDEILEFKKQKNISYPLVAGTASVVSAYKVKSLPTLYVIDREGRIADSNRGFWERDGVARAVARALEKSK